MNKVNIADATVSTIRSQIYDKYFSFILDALRDRAL